MLASSPKWTSNVLCMQGGSEWALQFVGDLAGRPTSPQDQIIGAGESRGGGGKEEYGN